MLSRRVLLSLLPLCALVPAGSAPAAPVDLAGYYRVPDNSLVVEPQARGMIVAVYRCATDEFCGRIAARGGLPDADLRNPEPESRARSLCGLDILSVEAPAAGKSPGALRGSFYDPRTGDDNAIELYPGPGGELHMIGHSGRPILSRTYVRREEIWQRVAAPGQSCEEAQPSS